MLILKFWKKRKNTNDVFYIIKYIFTKYLICYVGRYIVKLINIYKNSKLNFTTKGIEYITYICMYYEIDLNDLLDCN